MRASSLESRLSVVGKSGLNESELYKMKFDAWVDHGIIVLRPEQIVNEFDRQAVVNVANKLYGKRINK